MRSASWSASSRYWVVRKTVTPTATRLADDLPHGVPGARVEAGGRLVQEDDPGIADEGHGDVEATLHSAGVGGGGLPCGVGEAEALQEFRGDPAPIASGQVVQVRHEEHVLLAGDQPVDGGELPGDADRGTHAVRGGGDGMARHLGLAAVGGDERGEDLDGGGLAGAVRPEQGEHGSGRDVQIDAVEDGVVAVRLAQTDGGDRGRRQLIAASNGCGHDRNGHGSPLTSADGCR